MQSGSSTLPLWNIELCCLCQRGLVLGLHGHEVAFLCSMLLSFAMCSPAFLSVWADMLNYLFSFFPIVTQTVRGHLEKWPRITIGWVRTASGPIGDREKPPSLGMVLACPQRGLPWSSVNHCAEQPHAFINGKGLFWRLLFDRPHTPLAGGYGGARRLTPLKPF